MSEWDAIVLDLDGDPEMLRECLDSITSQVPAPARVIVFDNGSSMPTRARLSTAAPAVEHHRSEANLGFARGVNAALAFSSAELLAVINNDAVLRPGWSKLLTAAFEESTVAGAQSVIVSPDANTVDGAGITLIAGRIVQLGHGEPVRDVNLSLFWGVSATAAMYRRRALEQVSTDGIVFDERFESYYEDVDLAARLDAAGFTMTLIEAPLAMHHGSTTAPRLGSHALFLRTRNRYFVARLHDGVARSSSLLLEDLRRVVREGSRLRLLRAVTIARGAIAGLTARLRA